MRSEQSIYHVVANLKAHISEALHPGYLTHKDVLLHKRALVTVGLSTFATLAAACNPQLPALPTDSSHNPLPTPTAFVSPTLSPTETQQPTQQPLPTATYDIVTNTLQLTQTVTQTPVSTQTQEVTPTQETATPTELGTLAKVKIGDTEIVAGVDINFNIDLFGVSTPIRLVASHDISNIQADTWFTPTVNGKTAQEIFRDNFSQILNARPTKNLWGLTQGDGYKPEPVNLPPGTKLVFIFESYEDFAKTNLKWDPMANNDRVATQYDPQKHEFRVVYRGGPQDNIEQSTIDMSSSYGQEVLSQLYDVWTTEADLDPAQSDSVVMHANTTQLQLGNDLMRSIYTKTPFIHFLSPSKK